MSVFPLIAIQVFDFKNSIIKLYFVMILNLYLTSEWSQSKKKGAKVWFGDGSALKLNFYNLNSSDEGFWKSDSKQCLVL